jgi:hypothetical protein
MKQSKEYELYLEQLKRACEQSRDIVFKIVKQAKHDHIPDAVVTRDLEIISRIIFTEFRL